MNGSRGKILLIDDDETVHSVLRYHVGRAGFTLISAKDSETAIQAIYRETDLLAVLIDIHLPRPDLGWALLDSLCKLKDTLLVRTAIVVYSIDDDKVRTKIAGADVHFIKPVNYKDLIALIENYAEQRSKAEDL
ncbi:MAG: response regulator [Chloroflexota bacterium]